MRSHGIVYQRDEKQKRSRKPLTMIKQLHRSILQLHISSVRKQHAVTTISRIIILVVQIWIDLLMVHPVSILVSAFPSLAVTVHPAHRGGSR